MNYEQFSSAQWEYWGGFFAEALKPSIETKVVQPKDNARSPHVRTYYKPRLSSFDRSRSYLEHIQTNFGGKVREQSARKSALCENYGFTSAKNGYLWRLADTPSILAMLGELQPHLVVNQEAIGMMHEFLAAKAERKSDQSEQNESAVCAEVREAAESEYLRQFAEAKKNREIKTPLSDANLSGILDASGCVSIVRSDRQATKPTDYAARVEFRSDHKSLLKEIAKDFDIDAEVNPAKRGQGTSERRFVLTTSKKESVRQILVATCPQLVLLKEQATLAMAFMDFQQKIISGDELASILIKHSTPDVDLTTIVCAGFYDQMYTLNHPEVLH